MPGPAIRCTMVSVFVLRGEGADARVLLLQRRAGGHLGDAWSYVAGHVESGETGWQAALRELAEETALKPRALYATSFCEQFYEPHDDSIAVVPAFVAFVAEDADVVLNGEHTAHRWLDLDAAAAAVPFGSQRDLLERVWREFIERPPAEFLRIRST